MSRMIHKRQDVETYMKNNDCSYYESCIRLGMTEEEILIHIEQELLLYYLKAIEEKYIDKLIEMIAIYSKIPNIEKDFCEMLATPIALNTLFGKVRMSYNDILYFLERSGHKDAHVAYECLVKYSDRWVQSLENYIDEFKTKKLFY